MQPEPALSDSPSTTRLSVVVITREGKPLHHLAPPLGWDDTKYAWLHEMLTEWSPAVSLSFYVSRLKTDEVIDRVLQEA